MNAPIELLGLLIKKPDLLNDCQLISNFDDPFTEQWQNFVFNDIKELYETTGKCDRRELMKRGQAHNLNLDKYQTLSKNAGFEEMLTQYTDLVFDDMVKRKMQILGHNIVNCSNDEVNSAEDYLNVVRGAIDDIDKKSAVISGVSLREAVKQVLDKAIKLTEGDTTDYLKTGILSIDRLIYGLTTKTMSVIGARPSVGKSALGLSIMSNMCSNGIACGFISVEMSEAECVERIIQVRSGISIYQFARGQATTSELQRFGQESEKIKESKFIQIERTTNRKLSNIRSIIRSMKNKNPALKVIFIDYLQKINGSSKLDKRLQVEEVSSVMTDIATDLDIHVCALAQINREGDDMPRVKNLKEAGGIEQDAHYIFLIHRDLGEQMEGVTDQDCGLFVAKNRGGKTGLLNIKYNPETTRFYDDQFGGTLQNGF